MALQQVDQNIRAIQAIEASWNLPPLPDEVKLDLAGQTFAGAPILAQVLSGLADDYEEAERRQPYPTRFDLGFPEPVNPTTYAYNGRTEVGKFVAGVLNLDPPQQLDFRASQRLKQQLAAGGYLNLTPEEIESDRWLPEYSYAASRLNFDEMTRRFQGQEPGSFSVDQVFDWVDEWLSPRGLYRAAVELDLFWDPEAISHDIQTWGDKWRTWLDDKLNVRKLVDAVSGPLDDILFPALNIALMFTGIGEVIGVGRAIQLGFKGADAVTDMYRSSKLILAGAQDVQRLSQGSFLAGKVSHLGRAGRRTAEVMDAWRRQNSVILAKKANQQILRAGFVSNVQQWVDADRGGQSISHWTGGRASNTTYQMMSNPMLDWGVDLLLYPTNIFNPGTFSKPLRATADVFRRGFQKAATNQSLLQAYDVAIRQYLAETGDRAEDLARYDELRKRSIHEAIRDVMFDGDEQAMGAGMAYVTAMAGIDYHARRLADAVSGDPLHTFDFRTRNSWHHFRNQLVGQLRPVDPNNVEEMLAHLAKYGDNTGEFKALGKRGGKNFERRMKNLRDQFLESPEELSRRGAAVPAGHTRFVGVFDDKLGRPVWRPLSGGDIIEGDPYFIDVLDEEVLDALGDSAEAVLRGETPLPAQFANRYLRHDDNGNLRHFRLSEAASFRRYSPEGTRRLKELARHHNELRQAKLDEIMSELTPDVLAAYLHQVLPDFGRWDKFTEASKILSEFEQRGDLVNVKFVPPTSPTGRQISAMPWTPEQDSWTNQVFELMMELPEDERLFNNLMESVFSPFARQVDPQTGSFTVANADTVTKQEALSYAAAATRATSMVESIRRIRFLGIGREALEIGREVAAAGEPVTSTVLREVLAARLGAEAITTRTTEELARLVREAQRRGVDLEDLENLLLRDLEQINVDSRWSERFFVRTSHGPGDDLVKQVKAKVKELHKQAYFMASEVEGAPEELVEALARRNYKLVYGVEFAQPADLESIFPAFQDVRASHVRRKTLGDFFSRQDPEAVSALKMRKVRDAIHARLAKVPVEDGKVLNLGSGPFEENADMREVIRDLYEILEDVNYSALQRLDDPGVRFWERFATRMSLANVPADITRLASALRGRLVEKLIGRGYSRAQATAIYHALQSAQALGFRHHGLYAIESKLRSSPQLVQGLRLLGTIEPGDLKLAGRALRGGAGAFTGLLAANAALGEETGMSDPGMVARAGAMIAGGALGASRLGVPGVRRLADQIEQGVRGGNKLLGWMYLADTLANVRDTARFALSPIFDASRYSEAIILNQIGELPEGVRNLRTNQSPTAWRKARAKAHRAAGLDPDAARRRAQAEWRELQQEFGAAARGHYDFDLEAHHEISRRFASIGVLGFSPTDWMTSTFGHLRHAGVDIEDAYRTVREIYTYGMTGRSSAELSMNFVFFPFSFTKKTVGHFAKFFSDDLSRLIVLHDSVAAYQTLDEHYDLGQEWRDRLPLLQKAHRLNLLAYGIGLGQFGGVNAPLLEAFGRLPGIDEVVELGPNRSEIVNLFLPQVVAMNTMEDTEGVWETVRGMLPAINDVNTLIGSLVEQGYVVGSEQHLTRAAEQRHAWEEWRAFQDELNAELQKVGMSWTQATRHPALSLIIQNKRAELAHRYPSWVQGLGDGIAHSNAMRMEVEERLRYPSEPADQYLARFHALVDAAESALGFTFDGAPERVPPAFFDQFRRVAISYAREEPTFLKLYNRFYRRLMGDIVSDV